MSARYAISCASDKGESMLTRFLARPHRRALNHLLCLFAVSIPSVSVNAQNSVVTRHNDNARTGFYNDTALTTANVTPSQFGKLFSLPVDGELYAQPLYIANLAIPGKGTHNVIYAATAHNSVYAYDADDPNQTAPLWKVNFGPSVPASLVNNTSLPVEVGIISTPAIDAATGVMYVCNKDYFNSKQVFHLHAIDIATGAEKTGSPIAIAATVNGTGDGNDGAGHVPFFTDRQNQRAAVTLANGNIYLAFGAYEDRDPFHGWVLSYNAATLQQNGVHNCTPGGREGGIWMSGEGLAVDSAGNLYYSGGNGTYNGTADFGMAIMKLAPDTSRMDWFAPANYDYLNSIDFDLGTSGCLLMPGTNYLISGGKAGTIYVINPNNMTHFNAGNDQIIQEFQACVGHIHDSMAFWNSPVNGPTLYVWGERDVFKAFKYTGTAFNTTPQSQSAMQVFPGYANGPGVSVSANGAQNGTGVVWATLPTDADAVQQHAHGILRAFDADDLKKELYNSSISAGDDTGNWAKFCPPVIVNGKVYIASFSNKLQVYGLLPNTPPPTPVSVAAYGQNALVTARWDDAPRTSSYNILRSTTLGGPYTTLATGLIAHSYNDTNVTNGVTYYYRIVSVGPFGTAQSSEVSAVPGNVVRPVAYWRFEDGAAGVHLPLLPYQVPDLSGNGNTLQVFADGASPTPRPDTPGPTSNPTAPNSLSLDFSEAPPFGLATRDLYTNGTTGDLMTHTFTQFTIEASLKFSAFGGYQTFIGKDGQNIPNGDGNISALYFQSPNPASVGNRNIISIRTHQANGAYVVCDGTTLLTAGKWFNVAAACDGATLKLYVQTTTGGAYHLENSVLCAGGMYTQNREWTVGRGLYAGNPADRYTGKIDEVRISDVALAPSQFLFAPLATVKGRLALEGVSDLSATNAAAPPGVFSVLFRTPGTTNAVYGANVTLAPVGAGSSFGAFTANGVPPGTYDVALKGGKNLRVLLRNVTVTAATILADVTLPACDANNDNSVDSMDFGVLIGAYNGSASVPGSGYDPTGDFNFDGEVDSTDFSLIVGNYGAVGAP